MRDTRACTVPDWRRCWQGRTLLGTTVMSTVLLLMWRFFTVRWTTMRLGHVMRRTHVVSLRTQFQFFTDFSMDGLLFSPFPVFSIFVHFLDARPRFSIPSRTVWAGWGVVWDTRAGTLSNYGVFFGRVVQCTRPLVRCMVAHHCSPANNKKVDIKSKTVDITSVQ